MMKKINTKKVCWFCVTESEPEYKDEETVRRFVTERGKIVSRRLSGVCATHQRKLATEVKRARNMALLPFVAENIR